LADVKALYEVAREGPWAGIVMWLMMTGFAGGGIACL
jgi:hypothetical protein